MEQNKSIEQIFDTNYKNEIKKFKNSPLKGIILLLAGIATTIIYSRSELEVGGTLTPTLILAIIVFFIWGIFLIVARKTLYKEKSSGLIITFSEKPYDKKDTDKLMKMIKTGDFSSFQSLRETTDGGLKLRIAHTADKGFCFIQVLYLDNIRYIPFSEVTQLDAEQTQLLTKSNIA